MNKLKIILGSLMFTSFFLRGTTVSATTTIILFVVATLGFILVLDGLEHLA